MTPHAFTPDDVLVAMSGPHGVATQLEQGHVSIALCLAGLKHPERWVRDLAIERGMHFPEVVRAALWSPADVRMHIAIHTTSPVVVDELGRDPVMRVRVAVARRDDHLDHVAIRLACDDHPKVRAAIARTARPLDAQRRLVDDDHEFVLIALVHNPALHLDIAMQLAKRPENVLRRALARHTRHPEVLDVLSRDRDRGVRAAAVTPCALTRVGSS